MSLPLKFTAALAGTIATTAAVSVGAVAAEVFHKLSDAQIRSKFIGKQFTDEVHWGELYEANGKLTSDEMGRKRVGTWTIQSDRLCTDFGMEGRRNCYEVWMSGRKVELRVAGSTGDPVEGVLETPKRR